MVAGRKVLVVDDESIVTKSCRRILAEEGYEVDTTGSGRDGLDRAFAQDFDVVVADLRMPDLDGMEVVRALKRERPETAVVIISGYGTVFSRLEAAKLDIADYIDKPFTPERIRKAVSRALSLKRRRRQAEKQHVWPDRARTKQAAVSADFRSYGPQDWSGLLRMYLTFEPKAAYQGLPPFKDLVTRRWLSGLVENPSNTNFILKHGQEMMAHAALVHYPNRPLDQEIIIFVHQKYRHRGWGRKVLLAAMNWACLDLKLRRVWLSVGRTNVPARRLYASVGFVPVSSEAADAEIEMELLLQCENCLGVRCPIFAAALSVGEWVGLC